MNIPTHKRFKSWRQLRIGMVVYFSSIELDHPKLFEWVILDIDRDEKSIRVKPADGKRHRGIGKNGTKLHSVPHFIKTGELRRIA